MTFGRNEISGQVSSPSASVFISLIKRGMRFTCQLKNLKLWCVMFILLPPYSSPRTFYGIILRYQSGSPQDQSFKEVFIKAVQLLR